MIILIPVNAYFINKFKVLQIRQMKYKDERVKQMNEILSGIKVLKLYAWESSFEKQVLNVRDKEIQILRENAYIGAGTSFVWSCAPFLVTYPFYLLSLCTGGIECLCINSYSTGITGDICMLRSDRRTQCSGRRNGLCFTFTIQCITFPLFNVANVDFEYGTGKSRSK